MAANTKKIPIAEPKIKVFANSSTFSEVSSVLQKSPLTNNRTFYNSTNQNFQEAQVRTAII